MKIGVFDSGLGGLLITRAIRSYLPQYDYVYMGDTLHMPYGSRSRDAIYLYSKESMRVLFEEQNCNLIILACNSASAHALRRLQQEYLPAHYPDRRILGVIIPTVEEVIERKYYRIGLLGTQQTVHSGTYREEILKLDNQISMFQKASPLLVPMIEHDGLKWVKPILESYLSPLVDKGIDSLILGCTHYPYLKSEIRSILGDKIDVLSQDEIIPHKLSDYLKRHPEIERKLSRKSSIQVHFTDITEHYKNSAKQILENDQLLVRKV